MGNMVLNSNVSWLALKNYKEEEVGGSNIWRGVVYNFSKMNKKHQGNVQSQERERQREVYITIAWKNWWKPKIKRKSFLRYLQKAYYIQRNNSEMDNWLFSRTYRTQKTITWYLENLEENICWPDILCPATMAFQLMAKLIYFHTVTNWENVLAEDSFAK